MGFFDFLRKNDETSEEMDASWNLFDDDVPEEESKENDARLDEVMTPTDNSSWDKVVISRDGVNMHDPVQRREYIDGLLKQMDEGEQQLNNMQFDYRTVTGYLHDMEILDALSKEDKADLEAVATRIFESQKQRETFLSREGKLTTAEYDTIDLMRGHEDETVKKMADAENYQKKIRKDLMKLDAERLSYSERMEIVDKELTNTRHLTIFIAIAFFIIVFTLFICHILLGLDVAFGYIIAVLAAALFSVLLYQKHMGCLEERKQVHAANAKLVRLQNAVKVRYVNNTNLMDFLYLKYNVTHSSQLKELISRYRKERERQKEFELAERNLDQDQRELLALLKNDGIQEPDIWLHQTQAIINHNEEVEVRHKLITERQTLRKRMNYNRENVIAAARTEIEDLARAYPAYADVILTQVAKHRGVRM
ncbi:hypothetical protein [Butyrivibrio sp. NC3005]|uniref:hypothetical protein n=1 Tax=Butyrivibrio sp. NC3005 TaxID=1280685 RepID=UPI00041B0055|nr:hypothetical protein [Butyrivibrio sp. NC3005]